MSLAALCGADVLLGVIMLCRARVKRPRAWRRNEHSPWQDISEFEKEFGHRLEERREDVYVLFDWGFHLFPFVLGVLAIVVGLLCILLKGGGIL